MKFWVKAIVDDNVQEQLFVSATSTEELRTELEMLLNIPIHWLSVQDFQTQVVDRLNEGEDIIAVKIRKQAPASRKTSASETPNANYSSGCRAGAAGGNLNTSLSSSTTSQIASAKKPHPARDGGNNAVAHRYMPPASSAMTVSLSSAEPFVYAERADSHDRMNSSLGSGQLFARGGGAAAGSAATSPPESEMPPAHSTSPSKPPQLMEFPPVAKLWVSRDDVELLLTRQFRGKYKAVLAGCFVRTRDNQGYSLFQISSVEKGPQGKIILDTVYGTESVVLDTISNAAPSSDEVKRWMKKMLGSARSFPTHGFIEAKLGDVESAVGTARSILTASPLLPVPRVANSEVSQSFEASVMESQPPPSPVLSDGGEQHSRGSRARRPATLSVVARGALSSVKLTVKTNDALEFTSVRSFCGDDALDECGGIARERSSAEPASVCSTSNTTLVLSGTRHSNVKARKPRRTDFAGFEMILDTGATAQRLLNDYTPTPSGPPDDQSSSAFRAPPPPPFPMPFLRDVSVTSRSPVSSDRDTTDKGFALFGGAVRWQGRYICLGQRRPLHPASLISPYAMKDGTDDEAQVSEDDRDVDRSMEVGPNTSNTSAEGVYRLVQDFDIFTGVSPGQLRRAVEPTTLPIPQWAATDGREATILPPVLVEHLNDLHCFYLVRLDSGGPAEVSTLPTSAVKRLHHHSSHRRSASFQHLTSRRHGSGQHSLTSTSIAPPHTSPSAAAASRSGDRPPLEGPVDGTVGGSTPEATPPSHGRESEEEHLASTSARAELHQPSLAFATPTPPLIFSYGLAHAIAAPGSVTGGGGDEGPSHEHEASGAVSPSSGQRPLSLRWRLINASGPIVESAGEREPLFAVVSSPPEAVNHAVVPASASNGGALRTSADDVPVDGPTAEARQHNELNLLWYCRDGPTSLGEPPNDASAARNSLTVTNLFGGRSSFRLWAAKPKEGLGGSVLRSPAVSRRRSPAVATLLPEHSLGGRVELPFRRFTNSDAAVSTTSWVEDAYFAAVEVDVNKLTDCVESISLYTVNEHVFLATVNGTVGRVLLHTLPVTGEP